MIKPTKNRFFCPACGKNKMLFSTEKAANNFLKYNQAELIELYGKAPVRAYYCDVCMGWHLTSTKGKFVISSYQLLDIKLHQTAAEELSIYQSRMARLLPLLQIISSTKDERLTTIYNENSKRLKILFKTYECRVQEELGKQIQHLTR